MDNQQLQVGDYNHESDIDLYITDTEECLDDSGNESQSEDDKVLEEFEDDKVFEDESESKTQETTERYSWYSDSE